MKLPQHHPKLPASGLIQLRRGQQYRREHAMARLRLSLGGLAPAQYLSGRASRWIR